MKEARSVLFGRRKFTKFGALMAATALTSMTLGG